MTFCAASNLHHRWNRIYWLPVDVVTDKEVHHVTALVGHGFKAELHAQCEILIGDIGDALVGNLYGARGTTRRFIWSESRMRVPRKRASLF